MNVSDVMTTDVHVIGCDGTLREAAGMMREHDIGSLPVSRDGKLVGMVTDRDIVIRALVDRDGRLVGFMSLSNVASARQPAATQDMLKGTACPH